MLRVPAKSDALISQGGSLRSFAQAKHLILKGDSDFSRFVDASIGGAARKRALTLLELMPPGMRGDFVEIHADGSITSNRADLPAQVKFKPAPAHAAATQSSDVTRMSYPPTGGSGGPYIRLYSYAGINAAYGVATPPCDISLSQGNHDTGNMYFNSYSPSSSGSVTDAGVGADEYPSRDGNASDVFSFVNASGNWDPSQVSGSYQNVYESWPCGQPLVILYGTLPYPNNGTSLLAVGPPDYDPSQWSLPPATVTLQNPAWTFFSTPSTLNQGAGTYQGIASNCMGCSVAAMFTIAEPNGADGSCYGQCNASGADALWSNVVMGELTAPCGPNSFGLSNPCTLTYQSSGNWYAGNNTCDACNTTFGSASNTGGYQSIVEGISDLSSSQAVHRQITVQSKALPVAPSTACTPDAKGYCYVTATAGYCQVKEIGSGVDRQPVAVSHSGTYYVFKYSRMLELQGTYTKAWDTSNNDCSYISWSPGEPRVVYGDTSLP